MKPTPSHAEVALAALMLIGGIVVVLHAIYIITLLFS